MNVELNDREIQLLRDALAETRRARRGQLTLPIESEFCDLQNRLRQIAVRPDPATHDQRMWRRMHHRKADA
jgi:hypothetical protein